MPIVPVSYTPRPYVGSPNLGQLVGLRGQHAAEAELRRGEIAAQMWAQLGQNLAAIPQQYQQQKRAGIQDEAAALQVSEAKRGVQARSALGTAVTSTPHVDEDGVSLYDIPTISKKLEDAGFGDHVGDVASQLKGLNDAFRTERQAKLALVQRGAQSLLQANADPDLTLHFIDTLEKNGTFHRVDLQPYRDLITKDPSKAAVVLRQFAGPEKITMAAAGSTPVGETTGQVMGTTLPEKTAQPTEASLAYDLTSPDPAVRARANAAMNALKGAKPGSVEDWVARSRRLAVANNGNRPLDDAALQQIDTKALQEYKETNADPELRAAGLAQKNLAIALQQLQQSQQPTPEQAQDVAHDIVSHRLAPEQMSSMFGGFGPAGQNFKRMVYAEAKKLDPEFNFEQASSEYTLAKSPSFQQTVRYMDYVGSSVENVIASANRLANGKVRSLNAVKNWTKDQLNNVDLGKFQTDRIEVADAIAKILQGGGTGSGTSDAKLQQAENLLRTDDSPANIAGKMGEIKTLIGNRRKTLTRGTYLENAEPESGPKVIRYDMTGKVIP